MNNIAYKSKIAKRTSAVTLAVAMAFSVSLFTTNLAKVKAVTQSDYGNVYFQADSQSRLDLLDQAGKLSEEIASEGMILLENKNNSLPLAKKDEVTFIGTDKILYDGGGSSAGIRNSKRDVIELTESINNAGLKLNNLIDDNVVKKQ